MLRKIAIIGPESTGKSTLCERLAEHYNALWCPEYAREYLNIHGMKYTYDDLLMIAKGQVALEDSYVQLAENSNMAGQRNPKDKPNPASQISHPESRLPYPVSRISQLLFIDTEMYVMKVWCEFVFGKCHKYVLEQIAQRKYDLYFLCNIDLPWTFDELREYPDLGRREKLYSIYKDIMIKQFIPWVEISGDSNARLQKASSAVDRLITE